MLSTKHRVSGTAQKPRNHPILKNEKKNSRSLRGPIAILFISRETFSDSIAKRFCACFPWGIAQVSRDTLQNGVSH